jgi:hypothetical protein
LHAKCNDKNLRKQTVFINNIRIKTDSSSIDYGCKKLFDEPFYFKIIKQKINNTSQNDPNAFG